jgi:hypothetical protein
VPKALMVVGSNPATPEQEDEFNRWYVEEHFPDVLAVEGFTLARRYALSDVRPMAGTLRRRPTAIWRSTRSTPTISRKPGPTCGQRLTTVTSRSPRPSIWATSASTSTR